MLGPNLRELFHCNDRGHQEDLLRIFWISLFVHEDIALAGFHVM